MDESNEGLRVVPELYFLIAKFLSGGPLKETAKTLLEELRTVELLPRRLDWHGSEHPQSYDDLESQYTDISWDRLAYVCERAIRLGQLSPSRSLALPAPQDQQPSCSNIVVKARLSLLSDGLVKPKPKYASYKQDHSLVRRLTYREVGVGPSPIPGGAGGRTLFPPRLLAGLQLQRRTLGHLSAVYCLVFDSQGRYVVTGADDLLVKIWSAVDGRLLTTLRGAGAEITDVCVSDDGALVACGSVDKLVRVWSLPTGAPTAVLHAHHGTITSVHWSPYSRDVRWLASTSTDGSVAFWTCTSEGQFLSQPVQYVERMRPGVCHMICAAWSAGGTFLAAGSADHHVRIYSLADNGPKRILETAAHSDAVDSISWSHGGVRFVSGSKDGCAALWTLHAAQWRHRTLSPTKHDKLKVTMVCWDSSDAYVITAISDNTIRVWCSHRCVQVRSLVGHSDEAYVLEPHPYVPSVLLSAGHDGQLLVWDMLEGQILARFHNNISGQGDGAIFDAKWGGGSTIAASDSHGHLLMLGLGAGHPLFRELPTELFFHTDYRPLARDGLGGALDEQTETPPHLMAAPFLVDVEGAPHEPTLQRLVPGRGNMALSELIPLADARPILEPPPGPGVARGPWRGEGVRHTGGAWHSAAEAPPPPPALLMPLGADAAQQLQQRNMELQDMESRWYSREMRRRPLMISTSNTTGGESGPPTRRRRAPGAAGGPRAAPRSTNTTRTTRVSVLHSSTAEDESEDEPSNTSHSSLQLSHTDSSRSGSRSENTSSEYSDWEAGTALAPPVRSYRRQVKVKRTSSEYSDWEAGTALAPPVRSYRRQVKVKRYSPSPTKRPARVPPAGDTAPADAAPAEDTAPPPEAAAPADELSELYRPGEWLTAVSPRKAPYYPQMGDTCLYFKLGHQRYFDAVCEKDLYKVNPRDKPWERTTIHDCELVKVVGMRWLILPPRVVHVKLACLAGGRTGTTGQGGRSGKGGRTFTARYHDMPDVIDFLVLQHQYNVAVAADWKQGDRFRCMIDDSWWTGVIVERVGASDTGGPTAGGDSGSGPAPGQDVGDWARSVAEHFLSLKVRWDNGELERLSPWDLEPLDPERLPQSVGGAVPVLAAELEAVLYRAEPGEWPHADRAVACNAIAKHVHTVMSLSAAEPFIAPVDLQLYPSYAKLVPYPIDLATIKARFENLFYRRVAAAQFDVRYLASNAEQFNRPHSNIVRHARLVTDLLLYIITEWVSVDVVAKYHELAANYHSSDDEPLANNKSGATRGASCWRDECASLLRELTCSADGEPFREPVSIEQAPDYRGIISSPMDLGTVSRKLSAGAYTRAEQFAADVRLVFANSRLYNTNKRSRIYSMTVRLCSLFEALWAQLQSSRVSTRPRRHTRSTRARRRNKRVSTKPLLRSSSSSSEPLSAPSRRRHVADTTRTRHNDDSWDSDAPLTLHTKGKGVGKKTKSVASPEPGPSTSTQYNVHHYTVAADDDEDDDGQDSVSNASEAVLQSDTEYTHTHVLNVAHAHTTSPSPSPSLSPSLSPQLPRGGVSRALKRIRSSTHSDDSDHRTRRKHSAKKRTRERISSYSSSSGSPGSRVASPHRYESDRSYKPTYSTDDDAPLHLYRSRQSGSAGDASLPSTSRTRTHNGHATSGRVRLRARRPKQYNEDSDDDSAAAISKRHRANNRNLNLPTVNISTMNSDHNYTNGHHHVHHNITNGVVDEDSNPCPVSISSRGRVRKLTPKARGLLRE